MNKYLGIKKCIFIWILVSHANISFSQWVQKSQGLYGGNVMSLMEFNGSILAGTNGGGVYISNNEGDSWAPINNGMPKGPMVRSLAKIGTHIFAGLFSGGVYKSNDNGATWSTPLEIFKSQNQITTLHASGTYLFAGGTNGINMSSDYGVTWISRSEGLPAGGATPFSLVNTIESSSTSLFAGMFYKGIYRSNDNGASWHPLNGFPADADVESITINGVNILAGTTNDGVYLSTNNGDTWILLGGITQEFIPCLSYIGNTLFAGTFNSGLRKSSNNGSTWNVVDIGRQNSIGAILSKGSNIFIGTSDGIYRSTDGGLTWGTSNNNLTALSINSMETSGSRIVTGLEFFSGFFLSNDLGSTWNPAYLPKSSRNNDPTAVYISNDTIMTGQFQYYPQISTNGGVSWSNYASDGALAYLVNNGNVFRGTYGGLYLYPKDGNGWILSSNGINSGQWISSLTKIGSTIFASTIIGQGVLRSTDNGASWSEVNNGLNSDAPIQGVYASSNKLFAVRNNSLYTSSNLGNSWSLNSQKFNGLIHDIVYSDGVLYMAATEDILFSLNNGETWVSIGNDLPNHVAALSICANQNTLYAGTTAGVWEIPLSTFYPTIASFTPISGSLGTSVTINGTNFASPEFITVKINGVVIPVTASTPTSIIATVPANATSGLITVDVNGHVATSSTTFCVIPAKPMVTADLSNVSSPKLVSSSVSGNQWFFNGTAITGATNQSLTLTNSGSYSLQVSLGCMSPMSDNYCFNIPKPTITSDLSNPAQAILTSNSDIGNQWFRDGQVIDGAINKTLTVIQAGTYTVKTTKFGCASPVSEAIALIVTGDIDTFQNSEERLVIYPSPATNLITISFRNFDSNTTVNIAIYDLLGRQIKNLLCSPDTHLTEDISQYSAGIYLVKTLQGGKIYQAKFLKH